MKVLQVYKNYFPTLGGIENHMRLLVRGLREQEGVEVGVLVANTGFGTVRDRIDGVPVTRASQLLFAASAPVSLSLFRELARQPADLIHLHFPYPIGEMAYLLAGGGRPMVVSYHSDIVKQKRLLRLYEPFLWRLLARADRISVSNPSYPPGSPYLGRFLDKCVVIPHAVDPARFAPRPATLARAAAVRAAHGGPGEPKVLFVGKLRYYKGVEYLIEAMARVPGRLLVVGSGPMAGELRQVAQRLSLEGRVEFLGEVSDEDLPAYYYASDVFVLPSTHRSESWGAVQLEAMACGVPVVCTELGTGTSYVNRHEETGLVVPPRDATALAEALTHLLNDPDLRRRLGQQARVRVERELSPPVMVSKTVEMYREVMASKKAGR